MAFAGSYVDDMTGVLVASVLSRQHAIILGAPGWGKTAVSRSLAQALAGDAFSFTRLDPSTPPDRVMGAYNPAALLDGRLERVVAGTPYDPRTRVAILDEIGRANEVTFDALLDTLDRVDVDAPPVWATSNFMPSNERTAALVDRFGLWFWITPGTLDVAAIVAAQLAGNGRPQVSTAGLPTWAQIEEVRSAAPGPNAVAAIGDMAASLKVEAESQGRSLNPRRVAQWSPLLFRAAVWFGGSADFTAVPDAAARLLRYAWPAVTADEAATWQKIAASVVDTLGEAIEQAMVKVKQAMDELIKAGPMQKAEVIGRLTVQMQQVQANLESLAGENNPRVEEAVVRMNGWLQQAMLGQPIG